MPDHPIPLPLPALWAIEPAWLRGVALRHLAGESAAAPAPRAGIGSAAAYRLTEDGIAVIAVEGVLLKGGDEWGYGLGTVGLRRAVRQAAADPKVKGIMLLVDSPGGTVAGTAELAADVAAAARLKPLHAHIEDLGASAAYWIASQAGRLTATATSLVGSIGTYAVAWDLSRLAANAGIEVHVISTGMYKGAFAPGTRILPEHLKYVQKYTDALNEHFLAGVAAGRGMAIEAVREIADGRIHLAAEAQALGLLDAVESQDQAMAALRKALGKEVRMSAPVTSEVHMSEPVAVGEAPPPEIHAVAADLAPASAAPSAAADPAARASAPVAEAAAPPSAPMPQSDRAAVEKQAHEETREELKTFIEAFGPAGAAWFAAGKTLAEAQGLHAAAVAAERDRLAAEVADLKARVAEDRGSPTPVSFSPSEPASGPKQDLVDKVGLNIARVAAGLKFAHKN